MDLGLDSKYRDLREEVLDWTQEIWPPPQCGSREDVKEQRKRFRQAARERGFLARTVPQRYGGAGLEPDILAETVIREAMSKLGAPWRPAAPQGIDMLVPTLLEEGSPEQCDRYISRTLSEDIIWCQGYSEPGAGSDLGSLRTRAILDGDEWVLSGQKIWTSNAHEAGMMFGLFRTEPEHPRSAGLSYFLVPMEIPGIDVRPLRIMSGGTDFCEVFFDDARIPVENIVGRRGEGWRVSKATLKHERLSIGDPSYLESSFRELVGLAQRSMWGGRWAIEDPRVRARLAEIEGYVASQRYMSHRMLSAIARDADLAVLSDMTMAKLCMTNTLERIVELAADLLEENLLDAPAPEEAGMVTGWSTAGMWTAQYMLSLGLTLAGGTSNIQRNLIAERLYGMPRDMRSGSTP